MTAAGEKALLALRELQEARVARYKALSDEERENVLFLLAVSAGPQMDSAIWAVARPSQTAGGVA